MLTDIALASVGLATEVLYYRPAYKIIIYIHFVGKEPEKLFFVYIYVKKNDYMFVAPLNEYFHLLRSVLCMPSPFLFRCFYIIMSLHENVATRC